MDIVKFGVIGMIILLPFLFINVLTGDTYRYRERTTAYVHDQIEGAGIDAAFAMKTYSQGGYDSNDVYSISVPIESVVDTFFTSLKYREFNYQSEDFPALIIMGYSQVTVYKPETKTYSRPYYYLSEEGMLYTMGTHRFKMKGNLIQKEDIDDVVLGSVEEARRSRAIYASLQEAVANEIPSYTIQTGVYEDSFGTTVADDLGVIAVYDGTSNYGLGQALIQTFTPSGIMKSEIDY